MQQRHDVLVVGGGLVGASLAIALDRIGVDVGLVEATPAGAVPSVFDQRNLSFAEATVNALQALGVLPLLRRPGAPIRRIHVSRRGDFGRVRLEAADYGRAEFGRVVVARDFGEALEGRLDRCTRVRRYRPARFLSLAGEAGDERAIRIAAEGAGEQVLAARLLVAADGTRSGVRAALAIPTAEHDYRQVLFVARVRLDRAEAGTAWERFGRDGPSALLPRADGHHGAVHAVPADEAGVVATLDEEGWQARLQQALGWRAGRILESGPRSAYPALRLVAEATTAPRAVLVGNAAQTLHPIGAQGFNLGLRDALTLAELIADARTCSPEADVGAPQLLDAYVRRRGGDRERTLAFSHGLATLTATAGPLAGALRSLGLMAADRQPDLQGWLVGGAMGYRGEVPALCRGGPA